MRWHLKFLLIILIAFLLFKPDIALAACGLSIEDVLCADDLGDIGCACYFGGNPPNEVNFCVYGEVLSFSCTDFFGNHPYEIKIRSYVCDPGSAVCGGGGGGSSFLSGTQIATPGGTMKIEDSKEGDIVQSFDSVTKEVTTSAVGSLMSHQAADYYILTLDDGTQIKATGEHPIYIGTEPQPPKTFRDKLKSFLAMGIIYFKGGIEVIKRGW